MHILVAILFFLYVNPKKKRKKKEKGQYKRGQIVNYHLISLILLILFINCQRDNFNINHKIELKITQP